MYTACHESFPFLSLRKLRLCDCRMHCGRIRRRRQLQKLTEDFDLHAARSERTPLSVPPGHISRSSSSFFPCYGSGYVCAQRANFRPAGHQTERLSSMLAQDVSSHFSLLQHSVYIALRTELIPMSSSSSSERAAFGRSPSPSGPMLTSQQTSTAERSPSVTATFSPKVTGIPCVAAASRYTAPVHIDVGGTIYTSSLETLTK
jgi:hypothetical protein